MPAAPTVGDLEKRLALAPADHHFCDDELAGLPDHARRYLRAAIAPGALLGLAARLTMRGQLKLGRRWVPFRASETLAPHEGFVWAGRAGGLISGFDSFADGTGALEWKLLGLIRVAHGEGPDVARSAAACAAGETVWVPTALLPRFGVRWDAEDDTHLTAHLDVGGTTVALNLDIDDAGVLRSASFDRWGDPDNTGTFGWHRFGMTVTNTAAFAELTVPSAGRAGWHHGTDRWDHGEFFRYRLTSLQPVTATR